MSIIIRTQNNIRKIWGSLNSLVESKPLLILSAILAITLIRAIIFVAHNPPSLTSGETDSWWAIALNLINGHGYSLCLTRYFPLCGPYNEITAMREPVPVLFFAWIALLGRESLWVATLAELVIYILIPVIIFTLTKEWANTFSALIAAAGWAIYLPALDLIPQVSSDLLAALFVTAGILMTMRARKTFRTYDWLIAALWLGLAAMSRSATLVIGVVVIGGQLIEFLQKRIKFKELLKPTITITVSLILFMAPWLIRNQIEFGQPIIGSSLVGYNLYRHNYMIRTTSYLRYVGGAEGYEATQNLIASRPGELLGTENEAQMDSFYRKEALKIISTHPIRYLWLSTYRILPLWFNWHVLEAYGIPTGHHGYIIMGIQALFFMLAGLELSFQARRTWPLWGSIMLLSLAYMAVDSQLLYLLPVTPLLISMSAGGAARLSQKIFPQPVE